MQKKVQILTSYLTRQKKKNREPESRNLTAKQGFQPER